MGYTHYFEGNANIPEPVWDNICLDVQKILHYYQDSHINIVCGNENEDIITHERICLNDSYNGYDNFLIFRKKKGFSFCKTAMRKYDIVVCSILLLFEFYAPKAYKISSDGDSSCWDAAMNLNKTLLGHAYTLPITITENS